jgi:crotonobetainyl-CoA:carnitine CoA-transferase CaiB-like acyl-CoA transferase
MLLTDLGMKTIKVEPPGQGEGTRRLLSKTPEYSRDEMGAYFLTLNRGKKSIAIDLKTPEGLEVFYDLVRTADVVFDNFSAGVTKRLGIDFDALSKVNPKIVTCTVTGFGGDGPGSKRPSFDLVAQAYGGGMSLTGFSGGEPLRSGIPIGDLGGGLFGVIGVLAALHQREVTGAGQHVDISMQDSQISMLNYMATMHLLSGNGPTAEGNGHFVHVPYNAFPTETLHVIIAVISDNKWPPLLDALDIDSLRKPEYLTQPGRLADKAFIESLIIAKLQTKPAEHWLSLFEKAGVPCAPVNRISDAVSDEQVRYRNMVIDIALPGGGTFQAPGNPVKLSASAEAAGKIWPAPPELGAHTNEVLNELEGFDEARLSMLRAKGIIA